MKVRTLRKSDIPAIKRWLKTEEFELPRINFVVPGVAHAGLRCIDGGWALLDAMVTNPLCSSATRNAALEAIYGSIFNYAKYAAPKGLIGFTLDAGAQSRAKRAGFKELLHTVLVYKE